MAKAHPHKKTITQPPEGWPHFVKDFWEREPCHYKNTQSQKFITRQELFRCLVTAGEVFIQKSASSTELRDKVRFFLERTRVVSPARYLPTAADKSLEAYHQRLKSMIGNTDFTLVVNHAQVYSLEAWKGMRAFLVGLCKIIGLPLSTDLVIYLSRSATTAFGAHKDLYSNFLFQLEGQKRFRLWKAEVFERRPEFIHSVPSDEIKDDSVSFDVTAGDLLYMPSGYYHFAEGGNDLSIHVSLVLNADKNQTFHFVESLATSIAKNRYGVRGFDPFVSIDLSRQNPMDGLPAPLGSAFDAFANLDQDLKRSLLEAWTKRASAYGCTVVPPLLSTSSLRDQDLIQADKDSLIICHVQDNDAYVASNGYGFVSPAHPNLIRMIEQLKSGYAWRIRDLLKEHCGTIFVTGSKFAMDKEAALVILNRLVQMRAIHRTVIRRAQRGT